MITIVVPILNEKEAIASCLESLKPFETMGHEILFVDGGSRDGTLEILKKNNANVLASPPGRARQMNAGGRAARENALLFLHVDVRISPDVFLSMERLLEGKDWGWFSARLEGAQGLLRLVEWLMTLRSRLTGIATGDQGIFVRKPVFEAVGGFPDIPLMEDIRLCRTLKKYSSSYGCLPGRVLISSRRWEKNGIVRTIVLMWGLRFAHFLGVSPHALVGIYYRKQPHE